MATNRRMLVVCGGSGVSLLGQRSSLNFQAELQIDADKEIRVRKWQARDQGTHFVAIDRGVGTTGYLFEEMKNLLVENDKKNPGYVERNFYGPDARHVDFLIRHNPSNIALERGLAQAPAIGGLAIRHTRNREELEKALREITNRLSLGPDVGLEVWIVSSSAGGTGEGTHRFVGAFIANYLQENVAQTTLHLHFIRVGQLTYRTVNFKRTGLNSFFGIAADTAFAVKIAQDYPGVVANWYYVDLPDVGTGERSIAVRTTLVEMAAKAVMMKELQADLQSLLVNNGGIPMLLTRTGYWGKDFGAQRKYFETLRQLRRKVQQLLKPDYERDYVQGEGEPRFESDGTALDQWKEKVGDARYVRGRLEQKWDMPKVELRQYPEEFREVREVVEGWKRAVEKLVGGTWEEVGRAEWIAPPRSQGEGSEGQQDLPLRAPVGRGDGAARFGREEWFKNMYQAHEVRAWTWYLLGSDLEEGKLRRGGQRNLVEELLREGIQVYKALNPPFPKSLTASTPKKAEEAAKILPRFVELLVKVDRLLELEEGAERFLERELKELRDIEDMIESEYRKLEPVVGKRSENVVLAAKLEDELEPAEQQTWLEIIHRAVRRGNREEFKEAVLRGATGLTKDGLRDVLGLGAQADVSDMHEELASRMGRMYDPDGHPYEAPWWAATPATSSQEFEYRILPWLAPELQAEFRAYTTTKTSAFRYIFTKMGQIGLYVLAFQGLSLTRWQGDRTSLPVYLLRPFVPVVRGALQEWEERPRVGKPSGQLRIVNAGVAGEPLYLPALKEVGLTDEEIARIAEFYRLYQESGSEVEEKDHKAA